MSLKYYARLCLLLYWSIFAVGCASLENYRPEIEKKDFSKVTTEIKKIITEEKLNEAGKVKTGQKYNVELLGVSCADVVKVIYGNILSIPYVINFDVYDVQVKIDIVVKNKISHAALKNLTKNALNQAGFDVIEEDGIIYVARAKSSSDGKIEVNKDEKKVYAVHQLSYIKPDTLKNRISEILDFKDFKIYADLGSDLIFYSCSEKNAKKIKSIIQNSDVPEKQVYIEIIVIESSTEGILQNGLAGYLSTVIDSIKFAYSPVSAVVNDLNQFSIITDTDKFNAVLGVLQKENIISRIAAPYIIIKSGIEGKISIGDKIPILASTIITDDTTTQNVVYRETGLSMSVKPDVIGDQVNLNLNIEISSGEMNKLSNINSPSIKSRNLTSTIICKNSSAVLIGGIYQNESLFSQSGLPISNKYVQDYLNYNDKQKTKIELLFYVRPVILNNEAIAQLSKI